MSTKTMSTGILLTLFLLVFSGCIDTRPTRSDAELIIGSWYKEETFEDFTYKIVYEFYENASFFSGVWDPIAQNYNVSVRGTYALMNGRVSLNVPDQIPATSTHNYQLSDDGNTITIYYDDETFDVLSRQS